MKYSLDYIIRIYRFERGNPRNFVGTAEEVGGRGKKAFHTYDQLWEILNSPKQSPPTKPPVGGAQKKGSGG